MKKIGIVILTHGNGELTNQCIKSISEKHYRNYELIYYLIDSSPKRQEESILKGIRNKIKYEYLHVENRGYSAGNNIGIKLAKESRCDFILVTNNDVVFLEKSLTEMVAGFTINKDIGIVAPIVYLPNGEVQEINMLIETTLCGKYKYLLRKSPLKFLFSKYVEAFQYDLTKGEPEEYFYPHSVSGCCFMISDECADKVTPFDEHTFLYHEEVILGMQMERNGFKTLYYPQSKIIHLGGMSTGKMNPRIFLYFVESELYYFRNYRKSPILALLPLISIRFLTYVYFSIKNKNIIGILQFRKVMKRR